MKSLESWESNYLPNPRGVSDDTSIGSVTSSASTTTSLSSFVPSLALLSLSGAVDFSSSTDESIDCNCTANEKNWNNEIERENSKG